MSMYIMLPKAVEIALLDNIRVIITYYVIHVIQIML